MSYKNRRGDKTKKDMFATVKLLVYTYPAISPLGCGRTGSRREVEMKLSGTYTTAVVLAAPWLDCGLRRFHRGESILAHAERASFLPVEVVWDSLMGVHIFRMSQGGRVRGR